MSDSVFSNLLMRWPVAVAFLLGVGTIYVSMLENLSAEDVPAPRLWELPERPEPRGGQPDKDDRTPLEHLSSTFGLADPDLPQKLSGIGPVYWRGAGRGSGVLFGSRDIVLTTGHLFVAHGGWIGPRGPTLSPPPAANGFIYLEACKQSYHFTTIEVGSRAPRNQLGLDYAIARLAQPACEEAAVLTGATLSEARVHAMVADGAHVLNMGAYDFREVETFAQDPLLTGKPPRPDSLHRQHIFGVLCSVTGVQSTGDTPEGSTGIIETSGCDGVPGGSGGPLLIPVNGGAEWRVIGVANSYRPMAPEYNNYTRIEGAFAAHIEAFFARSGRYAVSRSSRDQARGRDDA